jgi:8-oxo-dGTP diphosphatase
MVFVGGKVLLGQRAGSHGAGAWSFPGGHLEHGESWEACAARETLEETGLHLQSPRFAAVTNDLFTAEGKHYVTIFMTGTAASTDARVMEPDKCLGWRWFDWTALPTPLFLPIQNLLQQGYVQERR